ncbi:MAG: hypothetical protein J6W16_01345 [Methanobrevibacter sp.]|nr:hypothetical protein [Methanobrevibacter sp.]
MIQVRNNLFETNSSSTHSLVMCKDEDFEKFKNGETCLNVYEETFEKPTKDIIDHDLKLLENGQVSFDGKVYDDFYDLCCDWENVDGLDWTEGRIVMYWMLNEGGFYNADIKQFNGVTAISIEYNSEI